jgi:hypothetical protein
MFDGDLALHHLTIAQTNPPAIYAPAPNWTTRSPSPITDALIDSIRQGSGFGDYTYSDSPAGMPSLTIRVPVQYYGKGNQLNRTPVRGTSRPWPARRSTRLRGRWEHGDPIARLKKSSRNPLAT